MPLDPRVTLLAVSAGSHRIPQPQASRHALSNKLDRSVLPFSIMPRQSRADLFTFTPNAPSRGLVRPSNIMLGIMRSRQSVTSARRKQQRCASHTLPSSHNLHYIKWPQPPLRGSVALAKPSDSLCSPQTPKGAYRRAQAHKLFMAAAVPQLAHFVCGVPRPTTRAGVPWPCSCPRSNQVLCRSVSSAKPRAVRAGRRLP